MKNKKLFEYKMKLKNNHKKLKKEKIEKKVIAVFLNILIIFASVSFSALMNSGTVKAEGQKGCCIKTTDGQSCVSGENVNCESGQFRTTIANDCSEIIECKPGTCIPLNTKEACMSGIEKTPCITSYSAKWFSQEINTIEQCQKGCCIIAQGVRAEVLQKRQCEDLTEELGYEPDDMEFNSEIIKQGECAKAGSPTEISCCVLPGGMCKYEAREACEADGGVFTEPGGVGGIYCSKVGACTAIEKAKFGCGIIPGTETDIYWFDNLGNQENLKKDCNYPHNICTKTNEIFAECKNTECKIEGSKGGQKMSDEPPRVTAKSIEGEIILTGTSMCYNFYTHYGHDLIEHPGGVHKTAVYETARSTGLSNQILHCNLGKIQIESLEPARKTLCINRTRGRGSMHANTFKNTWEQCSECGKAGALDVVGDLFGPFPPLGKVLNKIFGEYCTKESCESAGDCVFLEDVPGGWKVAAPGATAIGSCSPKYPPGTTANCLECGKGGDGVWNVCDEKECYAMGDCSFTPHGRAEKSLRFLLYGVLATALGRIVWIPVDCLIYAAIVIFPPTSNSLGYPECFSARGKTYFGWTVPAVKWLWNLKKNWKTLLSVGGAATTIMLMAKSFGK